MEQKLECYNYPSEEFHGTEWSSMEEMINELSSIDESDVKKLDIKDLVGYTTDYYIVKHPHGEGIYREKTKEADVK